MTEVADVAERTELLVPEPAIALAALLDVPLPDLDAGEPLPLTWHWLYLLERPRQQDLGEDGHPVRATVPAPPAPGRRRMWAGGSIHSLGPLRVGEEASRRSTVLATAEKSGRSGRLTFVTVAHTIRQRGEVALEERHDIVYRDAAPGQDGESVGADARALEPGAEEWSIPITPTLLFRFSALTYNAHRIHYDRDYARDHEGYPGLVVHGPLQAMAMAEVARHRGLARSTGAFFEYRLVAPLFEDQGLVVRAAREQGEVLTTARDAGGRRTAVGRIR
jgi:3-methylfumaryl-CoA hydratase